MEKFIYVLHKDTDLIGVIKSGDFDSIKESIKEACLDENPDCEITEFVVHCFGFDIYHRDYPQVIDITFEGDGGDKWTDTFTLSQTAIY